MHGFELHGRTLGLRGFGSIAQLVATIAGGLGMDVLAHVPFVTATAMGAAGARPATAREVIDGDDVLSLHLPLADQTTHLLDAPAQALMRPGRC